MPSTEHIYTPSHIGSGGSAGRLGTAEGSEREIRSEIQCAPSSLIEAIVGATGADFGNAWEVKDLSCVRELLSEKRRDEDIIRTGTRTKTRP